MKQKTSVDKIQLGMYVSELDRPWSAVPFEPPFEIQGFIVSSETDLNQIKKYCQYVYVDIPEETDGEDDLVANKQRVVTEFVEAPGALRNVRYVLPNKYSKHSKPAVAPTSVRKISKTGKHYRASQKNTAQTVITSSQEKWWDSSKRPGSRPRKSRGEYRPGRLTIRYIDDVEQKQIDTSKASNKPKLIFNGSETHIPVYPIQRPIEDEIVIARDIVTDTVKVCENLVHDVQAGRIPNTEAVKGTVEELVQSVIRNPDALNWLMKLKQQDDYTYYHSMAVCVMSLTVGRHLGLPESDLNSMGIGTLLQDIGKIHIPKGLLDKKEKLTSAERQVLRKHVEVGIKMLDCQHEFSSDTIEIVRSHHERHDGSGYPKGLHGDLITPATTIAAMSDTFQALTSDRPYRPAMTSLDALTKMYELGDEWFPQAMVEHLIQCVGPFPVGTFVRLNTGDIAVVISPNRIEQLKPQVMIVVDNEGNRLETPESLDLARQLVGNDSVPWKITQVVSPEHYGLNPREFFF